MVSKLLTNFKRRQILNYIADSFAEEFDTLTANDGREGLATALDKTPDIIISDIMMPNMDGNKMCRMLKSDIRTSHIPIILLTAKDSLEAKEEGYDSGAEHQHALPQDEIYDRHLNQRVHPKIQDAIC